MTYKYTGELNKALNVLKDKSGMVGDIYISKIE